jgi:hypothetical protein
LGKWIRQELKYNLNNYNYTTYLAKKVKDTHGLSFGYFLTRLNIEMKAEYAIFIWPGCPG